MTLKLFYLLHVLASVIWVGGMFFAHQCLRPVVVAQLQPPQRLALWNGVFGRFFPWVWVSIAVLVISGQLMARGLPAMPPHVHVMAALGYVMGGIFVYLYFRPYKALRTHVAAEQWPAAANALNHIRRLVGTNLVLGLLNISLVFVLPMFGTT